LKDELIIFLESYRKPASLEEISAALPGTNKQRLTRMLQKLEEDGELVKTRKNKYALPEYLGFVVGRLQGSPKGFGFVVPNKKSVPDIFVSAENLNGALHNDTVMVRRLGMGAGRKEEGEVVTVLTRANGRLVGTFETGRDFGFVTPDDNRLPSDVFIPASERNHARGNDKVVVEITRWPEKRRHPEGRVIEVIGRKGEPGTDIVSVIRKYDLPEQFPRKVLAEAEQFPSRIADADLKGREDLRNWTIVTIDGEDARDLDDGVSIRRLNGKGYRLGVHIADVGHYVREGSALDKEAFNRGTSVYLVDRVVPMLPPRLSNDLCSLNAGVDRLAMSVVMDVDLKDRKSVV
jgi:ribonuclease R